MLVKKENSLAKSAGSQRKSLAGEVKSLCGPGTRCCSCRAKFSVSSDHKLIGFRGVIDISHKKNKA